MIYVLRPSLLYLLSVVAAILLCVHLFLSIAILPVGHGISKVSLMGPLVMVVLRLMRPVEEKPSVVVVVMVVIVVIVVVVVEVARLCCSFYFYLFRELSQSASLFLYML